jgi:hypothetical protein
MIKNIKFSLLLILITTSVNVSFFHLASAQTQTVEATLIETVDATSSVAALPVRTSIDGQGFLWTIIVLGILIVGVFYIFRVISTGGSRNNINETIIENNIESSVDSESNKLETHKEQEKIDNEIEKEIEDSL